MFAHGVADPARTETAEPHTDSVSWYVPACVTAALKEVRLCPEHTEPPLQHTGEFWHWKLTPYGLDLMRILMQASLTDLAYQETFLEPERENIPQLVLMMALNSAIHACLALPDHAIDWAALVDRQPFLLAQGSQIDIPSLVQGIDGLIARIGQNAYTETGSRLYHHPRLG